MFGTAKFRSYEEGTHFTIETGHSSLLLFKNFQFLLGKLKNGVLPCQNSIEHRKGFLNIVADALSRSVADMSVLYIAFKPVKWFILMIKNVQDESDSYATFMIENGDDVNWRILGEMTGSSDSECEYHSNIYESLLLIAILHNILLNFLIITFHN